MKRYAIFRFTLRGFCFLFFVCGLVGCGKPQDNLKNEFTIDLSNGVTMEFVLIHPGSFVMGTTGSDNASLAAKPAHKVKITKPFYLGKYEVTQEQWQSVMGSNPSKFKGPKNPVECVSWNDCQSFLAKLEEKVPGTEFCLPTEAQWEYACRAESTGDFCYGNGEANLGEYAWYSGNSAETTHPVGEKKPNAWGLYDMHGNIWEYCADWYEDNYYATSPGRDPVGPASGRDRICRGGSYSFPPPYLRASFRLWGPPDDRPIKGMRVCVVAVH